MNNRVLVMLLASMSLAALAGCNRAEAPAGSAADAADTRQEAAEDLAGAPGDTAGTMGSGGAEVRAGAQQVEQARIDGERQAALEKCEALAGEAQTACKDSAEATYQSATDRLRTQMSDTAAASGSAVSPDASVAPGTPATAPSR